MKVPPRLEKAEIAATIIPLIEKEPFMQSDARVITTSWRDRDGVHTATCAEARGESAVELAVAGEMAGKIGSAQAMPTPPALSFKTTDRCPARSPPAPVPFRLVERPFSTSGQHDFEQRELMGRHPRR